MNAQTLQQLKEIAEQAIFQENVRTACVELMVTYKQLDVNELVDRLFNLCAEVSANAVSATTYLFVNTDELEQFIDQEQEKELQEMIESFGK